MNVIQIEQVSKPMYCDVRSQKSRMFDHTHSTPNHFVEQWNRNPLEFVIFLLVLSIKMRIVEIRMKLDKLWRFFPIFCSLLHKQVIMNHAYSIQMEKSKKKWFFNWKFLQISSMMISMIWKENSTELKWNLLKRFSLTIFEKHLKNVWIHHITNTPKVWHIIAIVFSSWCMLDRVTAIRLTVWSFRCEVVVVKK